MLVPATPKIIENFLLAKGFEKEDAEDLAKSLTNNFAIGIEVDD